MHASAVFVLAAAGFAVAQTTSAASSSTSSVSQSGCGSQIDTIIASCLGTTQAQLNACATNDWDCMCTQTTNVLTCYNNCPSDPARNGVLQQQTSYCNAASAYPSSTSMRATGSMTTSVSAASNTAAVNAVTATSSTASGTHTGTATGATPSSSTGAAVANIVYPGLAAAMFGLAALI